MIFNDGISSTDVIRQWKGNDERRKINNSGENIQDTRIPRTSYSQEWLCIKCGVFISTLFYNTTSGHGTKMDSNQLFSILSFFLSFLVLASSYPLVIGVEVTVARGHTYWCTHLVGLLWTSDRLVAETSTWRHTTLARDRHPCPRGDSNPQSQQASGSRTTP
jgi:hypothetical protein